MGAIGSVSSPFEVAMMWASCLGAVALVVSGSDLFEYDGTDVDRSLVADVSHISPTFLDVNGAADSRVNGVYRVNMAGDVWKNQATGARIRIGTLGVGKAWGCPGNSLPDSVWWMGYEGHGRYFHCSVTLPFKGASNPVPPESGWQVRNEQGFRWSKEYAGKSAPDVEHVYSSPTRLEVTDAFEVGVNGVYHASGDKVWKHDEADARILLDTLGAGERWGCPSNTHVWWMWYEEHGRYFNCATGSLPPQSGWQVRKVSDFLFSKKFAFFTDDSSPQVRFLYGR